MRKNKKPKDFPKWKPSNQDIETFVPFNFYQKRGRKKEKQGTLMMPAAEIADAKDQDEILARVNRTYRILRRAREFLDREWVKERSFPDEIKKTLATFISYEIYKYTLEVYEYQLKRALENGNRLPEKPWLKVNRQGEKTEVKVALDFPKELGKEKADEWFSAKGARCRDWTQRAIDLTEDVNEFVWKHLIAWTLFGLEDKLGYETIINMPQEELEQKIKKHLPRGKQFTREVAQLFTYFTQGLTQWVIEDISFPELTLEQLEYLLGLLKGGEIPLPFTPAKKRHLEVLSSHLYHNLRAAYAIKKFFTPEGERWPITDLSGAKKKLRAFAQLRPDPKEVEPYLTTDELVAWQEKVAEQVMTMDDLTADVFDAISAVWLKQAEYPEAMATITADDILRHRGLQLKVGGLGRRGGYKKEQREEIARHIAILSNTWITVAEMDVVRENEKGRRERRKWRGESKAVVVTSRFGEQYLDGTLDVHAWRVRPGDVFAKFLFGPGRQTALLSQRALEYDPYRQKWEKRLTRYFSWQWRIRQGGDGYMGPISVRKLLEAIGENVNAKHPIRTKEHLEKALNTLQEDGIIAAWRYEKIEEKVTKRRWWKMWLDHKIVVEPPQEVVDYYARLPQAPNKALPSTKIDLGKRIKEVRKERELTLTQAAEEIGISPAYLSMIETGKKTNIKETIKRRILKWLQEEE